MGKHIVRSADSLRTEQLGIQELFVQKGKGSNHYFSTWLHDPEIECCPLCGSKAIKNQNLFTKTYWDLASDGSQKVVIRMEYQFYKYRCLNQECHHIFAKPIEFASRRDNVTFRLENEIAHQVLCGASYAKVASRLSDAISRQAVGQIFNRWMQKKKISVKQSSSLQN